MYKAVIGLEVHIELNTESKMFSSSLNKYDQNINTNVSPIDLAFPGTMPSVNEEGVNKAISLCLALNSNIAPYLLFDRKNYYYPDLPRGFQITQMTKPLGTGGFLEINSEGKIKKILIHQIHIEEDSASLDHYTDYSLINYNRAGIPLIEVVTEPCIESAEEAIEFLESLKNIVEYLDISEADQTKGQIRCDVNVSLMKENDANFGVRVEVKNINSFTSAKETILYEIERQKELLNNNERVKRETRRFSASDGKTYSMREKAEAVDYKYYVEPNIPKIYINEELISNIRNKMPVLPNERKNKYINHYELTETEAKTLVRKKEISELFEESVSLGASPKEASNWIGMRLIGYLNKNKLNLKEANVNSQKISDLLSLISKGVISKEQAKQVFDIMIESGDRPGDIVRKLGIEQITDKEEIRKFIIQVLNDNEESVKLYKHGKTNTMGFLMGQILKSSGGKVNPEITSNLLIEELQKK